jgi:hypothetical protein
MLQNVKLKPEALHPASDRPVALLRHPSKI